MSAESRQIQSDHVAALRRLDKTWAALSDFDGPVQEFWELFLRAFGEHLKARRVLLLTSAPGLPWKALAQWPAEHSQWDDDAADTLKILSCLVDEQPRLDRLAQGGQALAMRLLEAPAAGGAVIAIIALNSRDFEQDASALMSWAAEVGRVPALYAQRAKEPHRPLTSVSATPAERSEVPFDQPHALRLYQILRLSIDLSKQKRFLQCAYELCNALTVRFKADRVSIGWTQGPYVRLKAISHVEKFDRLSALSRAMEGAMEEAADQGQAIIFPAPKVSRLVSRAHESYALMQGVAAVLSVPLMDEDRVLGVICLEKRQGLWSADDLWELQLLAQATVHPLAERLASDRWWGARLWSSLTDRPAKPGPRHVAWKLAGASALVGLIALFLIPWDYRVDARLTMRSKDLAFIPAPFDGYLRQVHVEIGDRVKAGQVLMQLDTRELALEESMAEAEVLRYSREAEKAQALRQLAEMQISIARRDQSASRLALVRHQLANAEVVAPQDGVVVEGELKKNLGAPVRKGDLLLKLAHIESSYLELEIDQSDVHEVRVGSRGEFALVGRPDQRFVVEVERIDPAAISREGRNVYLARGRADGGMAAWWRPGMGGTARLDAGERPLIWVMTHRTVRFLREFFWL